MRSLGNPDLTPARVAERIGISVRYLHQLFADSGVSFGRWLLARGSSSNDAISPIPCGVTGRSPGVHPATRPVGYLRRSTARWSWALFICERPSIPSLRASL